MAGGLDIHLDNQKEELDVARQRDIKQSEGDDLKVLSHGFWRYATVSCNSVSVIALRLAWRMLQLLLLLPEGREETIAAKYGQTVQYTKAMLHERFDLPIDKQVYIPP